MPLYEFVCQECHTEQELLVRGEEKLNCEKCGSSELQKLLSLPAAHAAKGASSVSPTGSCGSGCGCFPS